MLNALVDMYAKCGKTLLKGRNVFDIIPHHGLLAMNTYCLMVQDGIEADKVPISSVLACVLSL